MAFPSSNPLPVVSTVPDADAPPPAVAGAAPLPPPGLAGVRARLETMGCRVNRYDTAQLRAELSAMGCTVVTDDGPCDLYLLNTCTVTHAADGDARRLARRARRRFPDARVVLTGCYAEVSPDALNAMDEVDLVVGNGDKADLSRRIGALFGSPDPASAAASDRPAAAASPVPAVPGRGSVFGAGSRGLPDQGGATRFFLKVQEGCDVACAFCIIPTARGRARSMPVDDVISVLQRAEAAGYREVILAGIHLGGYGEETGTDLARLVRRVLDDTGLPRIRFGSMEPWGLSERFVELFAAEPRLLPYLHLPLQSGSASVLKRMKRPCTPDFYRRQVNRLLAARPDLYLSSDVLTGFPGETDDEFDEGLAFIESMPFTHLHVFPYSRREGTPAASMAGQVDERVKRERVQRLIALSDAKRRAALQRMVGTTTGVLTEVNGKGHTDNNHPIRIEADPPPPDNRIVTVTVTGIHADGNGLVGRLAGR